MTDTKRPWEDVADQSYFRGVLSKLADLGYGPKSPDGGYVRFGNRGDGHAPNFQIESEDGSVFACYHGPGEQKPFAVDERFEPSHLSDQRFTYFAIVEMRKRVS